MNKKRFTTPYREFIKTTVENIRKPIAGTTLFNEYQSTRYHFRLGPEVFSTDRAFKDIRIESENGSTSVDTNRLKAEPWILRNLQQGVSTQRKKERAEMFSKECFQRIPYSKNQRIAYNIAKSNKGL
ncbi:hypothetical protein [Acinetobacter venetianus]|uniref:hypothetical protein n=1 Tax=Acinetobacter venetianus TaxID=52133 RepID=UPI00241F94D8|nr:hypothetical protein [Acinetobacter venetianus]